jgi:hypothetical protein
VGAIGLERFGIAEAGSFTPTLIRSLGRKIVLRDTHWVPGDSPLNRHGRRIRVGVIEVDILPGFWSQSINWGRTSVATRISSISGSISWCCESKRPLQGRDRMNLLATCWCPSESVPTSSFTAGDRMVTLRRSWRWRSPRRRGHLRVFGVWNTNTRSLLNWIPHGRPSLWHLCVMKGRQS